VEGPPSSKRAAIVRRDDRESVRDGVGVDEEWEHQQVCGGERRCGSVGTCAFPFKVLVFACH